MGAAAAAGGAIYVECPPVPGVTESDDAAVGHGLLCVGVLPSGEAVPTRRLEASFVLDRVRAEHARLADLAERHDCLRETADALGAVLADLSSKLEAD